MAKIVVNISKTLKKGQNSRNWYPDNTRICQGLQALFGLSKVEDSRRSQTRISGKLRLRYPD
jgi:hypothetical protein